MDHLRKRILEEKSKTREVHKEIRELKKKESEIIFTSREEEAGLWLKFVDLTEGEQYFNQKHIDALKVNYDVCIHLSAKNAGKTTEIHRRIKKVVENGERFIYGRVYKYELDGDVTEWNNDPRSAVYGVIYRNIPYFFRKEEVLAWIEMTKTENPDIIAPIPSFPKLKALGLEIVGMGLPLTKLNSMSGGLYERYTHVIFDEILSHDPTNRIKPTTLENWAKGLCTIQRNKKNLKVYCYGNLQNRPEHCFLNFYGIDVDDNLRLVTRIDDNGNLSTKILFINSGELYKNTIGNKSGASLHGSIEDQIFLKYNKVIKPNDLILNNVIFEDMELIDSVALSDGMDNYYIEVRKARDEKNGDIYAARCRELTPTTYTGGVIETDEPFISNMFMNTTARTSINYTINMLYNEFRFGDLHFNNISSMENYINVMKRNMHRLQENKPNPNIR